ncbi:MAG: STELLO glycosyltransferase family protein, partial [Phycisphaerales bacterium]
PICWRLIVAGDAKTPPLETAGAYEALSLDEQFGFGRCFGLELPRLLPENHSARKNTGYLAAIAAGADLLYETDDDNAPLKHWSAVPDPRSPFVSTHTLAPGDDGATTCNVYAHFAPDAGCWPRGYPLERVAHEAEPQMIVGGAHEIGVWQAMADDDPDVDAIWRLTRPGPVRFARRDPVSLAPGVWCPVNSQNTCWRRDAFRWLYLPATTTMRVCDILRGYIAQRCLWADGLRVGFHGATVRQERNEHDLLRDLDEETLLYTRASELLRLLEGLPVEDWAPDERLVSIYRALASAGFVHRKEMDLVEAWSDDIERLVSAGATAREAAA